MNANRPVNWFVWREIPEPLVWQAVALSLGIAPEKIQFGRDGFMAGEAYFEESQDFNDRLFITTQNLSREGGVQAQKIQIGQPKFCTVRIRDFAAWALKKGWSIPEELTELASAPQNNEPKNKWPWGDYETKALKALDAAICRWWIRYDPEDATTAPTNTEVAAWLVQAHGLSQTQADNIAAIIKADGIRPGPRRSP